MERIRELARGNKTNGLTWEEYQRIKNLKELDIEICDYRHVNILNLGWEAWGKWYCSKHEREHVLCPSLCLPVSRNIIGCELTRKRTKRTKEPIKPNKTIKPINKNNNSSLEGKAFGCSEIFTLDYKGAVIKQEWKCEEIKN